MISGSYGQRPKRVRYSDTCVQLGDLVVYSDEIIAYQISFEFWGLGLIIEEPYKCKNLFDSTEMCCKVMWLQQRYVEEMSTNFLEII